MSIELLAEAQEAAFAALRDICQNPAEFDVETQNLRANIAFGVVNMVPAGAFDFSKSTDLEVIAEQVEGEVIDFPSPEEIEQQAEEMAAIEQVTVNHQPSGLNPHAAPPLGGAS